MIVSTTWRGKCYEIAHSYKVAKLIPKDGREIIVDKSIAEFEKHIDFDPVDFTNADRESIVARIAADPQVKQFAFIPIIMSAVISWIIQMILQSLWDWYKNPKNAPTPMD